MCDRVCASVLRSLGTTVTLAKPSSRGRKGRPQRPPWSAGRKVQGCRLQVTQSQSWPRFYLLKRNLKSFVDFFRPFMPAVQWGHRTCIFPVKPVWHRPGNGILVLFSPAVPAVHLGAGRRPQTLPSSPGGLRVGSAGSRPPASGWKWWHRRALPLARADHSPLLSHGLQASGVAKSTCDASLAPSGAPDAVPRRLSTPTPPGSRITQERLSRPLLRLDFLSLFLCVPWISPSRRPPGGAARAACGGERLWGRAPLSAAQNIGFCGFFCGFCPVGRWRAILKSCCQRRIPNPDPHRAHQDCGCGGLVRGLLGASSSTFYSLTGEAFPRLATCRLAFSPPPAGGESSVRALASRGP